MLMALKTRAEAKTVDNIALIGMFAAGKSKFGKRLAPELEYRFVDTDKEMERKYGKTLQEIVDSMKPEKFLELEKETVLAFRGMRRTVIAPGGSVVYSQEAMDFLVKESLIIYLSASLDAIKRRVEKNPNRGIVGLDKKSLRELYEERTRIFPIYADLIIDATERDLDRMTDEALMFINARRREQPQYKYRPLDTNR